MSRVLKLLSPVMLFGLTITGCTGNLLESKVEAPQVYVLRNTAAGAASTAWPVQLSIAISAVAPGLDTNRIAVLRNKNQLDYFYGARWGGTAPQVVQSFLVALLQSQQGYRNVVADPARVDADYILDVELRQFQAEYTGNSDSPVVQVELAATVFEVKSRNTVTTLHASASAPTKENRLSAVIAAFQLATQTASMDLSEQLGASFSKTLLK